ncbi:dicarboxylate transporter/tellurite-resistance protein TehA [Ancylobacter sp. WKF20]|uniref:dicarboxylate transporter/tellurite-resistance protein TehA n=1 Tax=Ancylobacter sp. WKF20 TaxID=3039801 RepID=UPI0024342F51|nr:dicarboxylate transporter/tellurite-resistance protein TehA [Ancylobacter sp. WKF20]WGD29136.1 dicarboxylate transporter/tellurite-resistance protein TehA [Ancylobacter sp. WKF20]
MPQPRLPIVPVSFFGMVLGLVGLGGSWRAAHHVWDTPALIGEAIMAVGSLVWAVVLALYALKWLLARPAALAEMSHPVQSGFVGLAGVATLLVSIAAAPYSRDLAILLLLAGAAFTLGFGVWRSGALLHGERDPALATPVLYLPTVAGCYVTGTACGVLGYPDWGQLAFGAGLFSWLAMESVLLYRFQHGAALAPALRPTLGIQLAPPVVGAVTYLAVTSGPPDIFERALIGYGLLQLLLLARLLPWILKQSLSPAYWAFTFGLTALATASIQLIGRGETGALALLAPALLALATAVVAITSGHSLWLLLTGRLVPAPAPPASTPA